VLVVAFAVLVLAVGGLIFIVTGLALVVGSIALPALLLAGGVIAGVGVLLLVVALLVIAVFPPVRAFFNALVALLRIAPDLGAVMRSLAAALLFASQLLETLSTFLNDRVKPIASSAKAALDELSLTVPNGGVEVPHFDLSEKSLSSYGVPIPSGMPDPNVFTKVDRSPRHVLDVHDELQAAADAMSGIDAEIDARRADAHDAAVALNGVSVAISSVFGTAP
jgi:hypothetical protein